MIISTKRAQSISAEIDEAAKQQHNAVLVATLRDFATTAQPEMFVYENLPDLIQTTTNINSVGGIRYNREDVLKLRTYFDSFLPSQRVLETFRHLTFTKIERLCN